MNVTDDRNNFVELLQNFRKSLSLAETNREIKPNDTWGCDHDDSLFELMLNDRTLLKKFMLDAIVPPTTLQRIGYLFSRYTCFKFFERNGISFWRAMVLLDIPQTEFLDLFPIVDLRHVFGQKIAKTLLEKMQDEQPHISIQGFSNCCADYNSKNRDQRNDILQDDFSKSASKRFLIHFFKKKDWGLSKKLDPPPAVLQKGGQKRGIQQRSSSSPSPSSSPVPVAHKMPRLTAEVPTRRSLRKQMQNSEKSNESADERDGLLVLENGGEEKIVDFDNDDEKQQYSPFLNVSTPEVVAKKYKDNDTSCAETTPETSADPSANEEMLEIPPFSLEDLKYFGEETDPYALYALTFACFERSTARMQHVMDVLKKEKTFSNNSVESKLANFDQSNGETSDGEESEKVLECMAEKLRDFMAFFLPKSSKLTQEQIQDMTIEDLCNVNLAEFGKSCEAEFSRLIEDRKRVLREKFDAQTSRLKSLLTRVVSKYQPQLSMNDSMSIAEMEHVLAPELVNGCNTNLNECERDEKVNLDTTTA